MFRTELEVQMNTRKSRSAENLALSLLHFGFEILVLRCRGHMIHPQGGQFLLSRTKLFRQAVDGGV